MMPSRGFQLCRGSLPRTLRPQSRNLSSTPPTRIRNSSSFTSRYSQFLISQSPSLSVRRPPFRAPPTSLLSGISSIRHASTTPAAPAASAITENSASSLGNLDTIVLDNFEPVGNIEDISKLPEQIGYLQQIGLDYGWGVTSSIQWILEHVHVYSGMPWWGSIILTGVSLRLVMLPLFIASSDSMARASAMLPITKPITDRMTEAQKSGNQQEMMMCWQELSKVRKDAGVSMSKQLIPIFIQAVTGYCGFKLLHAMSVLPVPGFLNGGFLWLENLSLSDGYLILPVIMAGTIHMVVRFGGESGVQNTQQLPPFMKNLLLYGMPGMMFFFLAWQPAGVALWFTGTGLVSVVQGQALQKPKVRELLGIAPLYKPEPSEGSGNALADMYESFMKDAKKTESPQARSKLFYAEKDLKPNLRTTSSQSTIIDTTLVENKSNRTPPAASSSSQNRSAQQDGEMIQPGHRR